MLEKENLNGSDAVAALNRACDAIGERQQLQRLAPMCAPGAMIAPRIVVNKTGDKLIDPDRPKPHDLRYLGEVYSGDMDRRSPTGSGDVHDDLGSNKLFQVEAAHNESRQAPDLGTMSPREVRPTSVQVWYHCVLSHLLLRWTTASSALYLACQCTKLGSTIILRSCRQI